MGRLKLLILSCFVLFSTVNVTDGTPVGLNWGRLSSTNFLSSMVVDMVLSNGIQKMKLHNSNPTVLEAFSGSKLEFMMTIPNSDVRLLTTPPKALAWIQENATQIYKDLDINVKYLMVGNEPYNPVDFYTSGSYVFYYHTALAHVSNALKQQPRPYNEIKASIPHSHEVLLYEYERPSEADFAEDVKEVMNYILETLSANNAPFVVNIYPLLFLWETDSPCDFGFFDNASNFTIRDGNLVYNNAFDFLYDSFVVALAKNGYGHLDIIVSQTGWPTDGHICANVSTAKRFYDGFLSKMAKDKGTPLRPGPIQAYIYNLNDESSRIIRYQGPSLRHYGLYDKKGRPKFQIDLSMKGRKDVHLEPAHGVITMPRRWCVLDEDSPKAKNESLMWEQFAYSCGRSDCSKLYDGGSYNNLTFKGNVSYGFNMFFQTTNQKEAACDFEGLGKIVLDDPSEKYGCHFPLQFLTTVFTYGGGEVMTMLADSATGLMMQNVYIIVTLLSLFFYLLVIL